jgi:hypothetical protein
MLISSKALSEIQGLDMLRFLEHCKIKSTIEKALVF